MIAEDIAIDSAARGGDRDILAVSAIIWTCHFALMVSRAAIDGMTADHGAALARATASIAGFLAVCAVYAIMKWMHLSGTMRRFLVAALFSIPACALVSVINETAFYLFSDLYRRERIGPLDPMQLTYTASYFFWIFGAWAGLYATILSAQDVRDRERRLAASNIAVQQAQMNALRSQLNPHFIFNTLNTLSGLVTLGRNDAAETMIVKLSALLRFLLLAEPSPLVSLAEEIESQMLYLDIERIRFADRLSVRVSVPSDCQDATVPCWIMQPAIENAVRHALEDVEHVELSIAARRDGEVLRIMIENDFDPAKQGSGLGIGLRNSRERLHTLYGGEASIEAGSVDGKRWVTELRLPWSERRLDR